MADVLEKNTYPIFAGRGKGGFLEYKSKIPISLSLNSKAVFNVLQAKAQSPLILSTDDTTTLNVVAELT